MTSVFLSPVLMSIKVSGLRGGGGAWGEASTSYASEQVTVASSNSRGVEVDLMGKASKASWPHFSYHTISALKTQSRVL